MSATWCTSHEMGCALADRELAECLAELADYADDSTIVLLTRSHNEQMRRQWTEGWWQHVSEGIEPIGV